MRCATFAILAAIAAAGFLFGSVTAECPKTHSFAVEGATGDLNTLSHEVAGTIKVIDDCTFEVNLTYDGDGPAAYWYGAQSIEEIAGGITIDVLDRAYNDEVSTFKLPEGVTWDDTPALSVWCVDFAVDFGSVLLTVPDP